MLMKIMFCVILSFRIYIYIYIFFFFKFLFLPDNLQRDGHKIERRVTAIIQKALRHPQTNYLIS